MILILCSVLISLPFVILSHPYADDFCTMKLADTVGWNNASVQYQAWSGRFASNEAVAIVHGFAPWLIPLSFAAWGIGLVCLLKRTGLSWSLRCLFAGVILLTMLAIAPDVYQSYMWTTGLLTYSAPLILLTWALVVFDTSPSLAALIAFFAVGCSDIGGVLIVGTFGGLMLLTRQRRALLPLVASLIALLLVVMAPGNAIRQSYFPAPSLVGVISAMSQTGAFLVSGIIPLTLLIVMAIVVGLNAESSHRPRRWVLSATPLTVITFALVSEAASGYALSGALIARAWIIPQYVTVLGAAIWGYTFGLILRSKHVSPVRWAWIGAAFMLISLAAVGRLHETYQHMTEYAAVYDSGRLLDHEEAWIVSCAKEYYVLK